MTNLRNTVVVGLAAPLLMLILLTPMLAAANYVGVKAALAAATITVALAAALSHWLEGKIEQRSSAA